MQWSRFNLLFRTGNNEPLLYNSGSGTFMQLDEGSMEVVNKVKVNPNIDLSGNPDLYFKLRFGGFLVEDGADNDFVRILKMNRLASNYSDSCLNLTIAISKMCNFDCEYCYEHNRTPPVMTDETADELVRFIIKHRRIEKIKVIWYGGEPLIEFDKLKSLSEKIQRLGLEYDAHIITNGYLLTPEVIESLDGLKISHLQITIDGMRETHNSRRRLKCGNGTYDRIIGNIDNLMRSEWSGRLNLRINVDKRNSSEFIKVYQLIERLYPDKFNNQVRVYPGFVDGHSSQYNSEYFNSYERGKFLIDLLKNYRISPLSTFPNITMGGCTLTKKSAYVVGPKGELYKCWRNLGYKNEIIGDIHAITNWNMSLVAEGMVGASYLYDDLCERCLLFPVCDGGCPKMRMLNNRDNGNRDTCTYFKEHTEPFLENRFRQKDK
jgi:uncharacterized protein